MADIVPAWMWRDPGEVIERLLDASSRRRTAGSHQVQTRAPVRDRYYTQARRIEVRAAVERMTNNKRGG